MEVAILTAVDLFIVSHGYVENNLEEPHYVMSTHLKANIKDMTWEAAMQWIGH